MKRQKKRLNVWLDEDLFDSIRKYADTARCTRSYAVYVLCTYGLDYLDSIKNKNTRS